MGECVFVYVRESVCVCVCKSVCLCARACGGGRVQVVEERVAVGGCVCVRVCAVCRCVVCVILCNGDAWAFARVLMQLRPHPMARAQRDTRRRRGPRAAARAGRGGSAAPLPGGPQARAHLTACDSAAPSPRPPASSRSACASAAAPAPPAARVMGKSGAHPGASRLGPPRARSVGERLLSAARPRAGAGARTKPPHPREWQGQMTTLEKGRGPFSPLPVHPRRPVPPPRLRATKWNRPDASSSAGARPTHPGERGAGPAPGELRSPQSQSKQTKAQTGAGPAPAPASADSASNRV
jgi:hypothetical protein